MNPHSRTVTRIRGLLIRSRILPLLGTALLLSSCGPDMEAEAARNRQDALRGQQSDGDAHRHWTSLPAGTWRFTNKESPYANASTGYVFTVSGTLFVDYANQKANGSGKRTTKANGMTEEVEYNIHRMRLIRADEAAHHAQIVQGGLWSSPNHPIIAVFEGEFRVHKFGGAVFRSSEAFSAQGPDYSTPSPNEPHAFAMQVVPEGINLRDGIEYESIKYTGNLVFER